MNKKAIITILLAVVAMAGQAQTFTPVVEDSIDFVIRRVRGQVPEPSSDWTAVRRRTILGNNFRLMMKD